MLQFAPVQENVLQSGLVACRFKLQAKDELSFHLKQDVSIIMLAYKAASVKRRLQKLLITYKIHDFYLLPK